MILIIGTGSRTGRERAWHANPIDAAAQAEEVTGVPALSLEPAITGDLGAPTMTPATPGRTR